MTYERCPEYPHPDRYCKVCRNENFVPVDGPVYRATFGIPDDGSTETAEAYDAWLEFDALVKAGWVVEIGEDNTPEHIGFKDEHWNPRRTYSWCLDCRHDLPHDVHSSGVIQGPGSSTGGP